MLRVLAIAMRDVVGASLDSYELDLDERFEESLRLLDRSGLIGSDELRRAFEVVGIDDPEEHGVEAAEFILLLAGLLEESASRDSLAPDERAAAFEAGGRWRELVEHDGQSTTEAQMSVAQVASHFSVTPQAVYKWIEGGKIEYERTPGGSYRIPAAQFDLDRGRAGAQRRREARQRLLEKYGSHEVDGEDLNAAIRKARRGD